MLVVLVRLLGSVTEPCRGLLTRESNKVPAYLSVAMSSWTPLKSGFEKVMGVSVVRIWSPTVMA